MADILKPWNIVDINEKREALARLLSASYMSGECLITDMYLSIGRDVRPRIRVGRNGRKVIGARLVYECSTGIHLSPDQKVLHRCDNTRCLLMGHLFVGTQADNVADMISKGRGVAKCGEDHGCAKLTEADVAMIRKVYASGSVTQKYLASKFGVSKALIWNVLARKGWVHVD